MDSAPVVALPNISLVPVLPTGDMVTFLFYIVLAFYVIFTGILYYHWSTYTSDVAVATMTYIVYFVITVPLMIAIASSAFIV
ncbi:MAG: hypothetical protein RLZZ480_30 [Candidatus Parcubacteria bacterium]|jgi:hypothetical protein